MVKSYTPKQGDIIWISLDPVKGHEQKGRRPALVISTESFSALTKFVVICPITNSLDDFPTHISLDDRTETSGVVLCEHFKSLDYRARYIEFKEAAPKDITNKTIAYIASFFDEEDD